MISRVVTNEYGTVLSEEAFSHDAELGRFINGDSINYLGTNGGLCAYNLFAYCNDNPVAMVDESGTLAYPGQIHNIVVNRIAARYGLNKEQTINYSSGWGRADLISDDGGVWDVKRDKEKQIKQGALQVERYVANTWKNHPEIDLYVGGYIKSEVFTQEIGLITYSISYRYAGEGVIAYTYEASPNWRKIGEVGLAISMSLLAVATFCLSGGAVQLQPSY